MGAVEEVMCQVDICCRGDIVVMDVRWRRLCVGMFLFEEGDLFVLNWARVRRV